MRPYRETFRDSEDMSLGEDERLVRELGMSVAHGGVAYVPSDLQLTNGQTAIPELIAMSGWSVKDIADAVRAAQSASPVVGETSSEVCRPDSLRPAGELADGTVPPPSASQRREGTV